MNNFKTILSNDYDSIITQIMDYMKDVRVICEYCKKGFRTLDTLTNHKRHFHRIL